MVAVRSDQGSQSNALRSAAERGSQDRYGCGATARCRVTGQGWGAYAGGPLPLPGGAAVHQSPSLCDQNVALLSEWIFRVCTEGKKRKKHSSQTEQSLRSHVDILLCPFCLVAFVCGRDPHSSLEYKLPGALTGLLMWLQCPGLHGCPVFGVKGALGLP